MEKHTANSVTKYRHYINAGEQPVALYTRWSSGTLQTQYFLLDHQGSVAEITNSLGTLDVPENFAAFGQRRDASDWSGSPSAADQTIINAATQRGYTFHTNAESSSLIHMNGRMADSLTGRFLSADPFVFQPLLTQAFNRYSYVNNNPLSYTDPSGFCVDGCVITGIIVSSAVNYLRSKLFGKKKRPPPPKGCLAGASATGCYGKAVATKLFNMASDIYGLPRLGSSSIWGGSGGFGTGACGWGAGCMSWDGPMVSAPLGSGIGEVTVNMEAAYREYLFRAAIRGRESKFALEPLVKSGAIRLDRLSPIAPQDDFTRNTLRLQAELELTGDTNFVRYVEMTQAILLSSSLVIPAGFGGGTMTFGSLSVAIQTIRQSSRIMRVETAANAMTLMNIAGGQGFAVDTVSAVAYELWLAERNARIAAAIMGLEASK